MTVRALTRADRIIEWLAIMAGVAIVLIMAWAVFACGYAWWAGSFIAFVGTIHVYSSILTLKGHAPDRWR